MPLNPEFVAFEQSAFGGHRVSYTGPADQVHALTETLQPVIQSRVVQDPPDVEKTDTKAAGVSVRIYKPRHASAPVPMVIYAHAGGLMTLGIDFEDAECVAVAGKTQSMVISVDYRLSPQNKWPTQLDDCFAVYQWAFRNAAALGGDPKKIITAGGSGGGLLATALPRKIYGDAELKDSLRGVFALYPAVVHPDNVPSKYKPLFDKYWNRRGADFEDSPGLTQNGVKFFWDAAGLDPSDASAFAVLSVEETKKFPPTYLVSAEYDPLAGDAAVFEQLLKDHGVPVKHDHYEGGFHFWHHLPLSEAPKWWENLISGVKWLQSQM